MSQCKYARLVDGQYEFGHIAIHNSGTKTEKREHVKQGVRPTLDAALIANQMTPMAPPRTKDSAFVSISDEVAKVIRKAKSLRETDCVGVG